jgi:hypothetical protein
MGTERELEAMNEFIEKKHDPDYGWIDIWNLNYIPDVPQAPNLSVMRPTH